MSRAANPIRHSYNNLKANAKRRGKEFTITLEYFTQFCHSVKYIGFAGRRADSHTIDRKDETKGYIPGNLQVLPNTANVRKYFEYHWQTKTVTITDAAPATEDFDAGFEEEEIPF